MNALLSSASEKIQHEVNKHFMENKNEFKPYGLIYVNTEIHFLYLPDDLPDKNYNQYFLMRALKTLNSSLNDSEVCGITWEVFFQEMPIEEKDNYEYGKMNDKNASSAIMIFLQERESKEKTFSLGIIKNGEISEWKDNHEQIGGDVYEVDLYE